MKRHKMKGGPASHGCSKAHRKGGSTGQRDDPGKVCVKMLLLIELSPKQELTC